MKKLYTLFLATFIFTALNAQVVLQSDFSTWPDTMPAGWGGAKTSFIAANVQQVTTGSQFGTSSVRLINTTTSHKRFTTEPLTVAEGDTFEIKFWAKGKGDVRTGIFDNNLGTGNFGYHYNSYISINTANWTMYTQLISADTSWSAAEFIFSVRSTDAAMSHIQIDSVVISYTAAPPPVEVSIAAIQGSTSQSPYANQLVITKGVVTAFATYKHPTDASKDYRSYFMQDGDSAWSGIWVYDTVNYNTVVSGDSVYLTALVEEFFGNYTRLKNITAFSKVSAGAVPVPVPVTALEAKDEKFEGVLVEVTNAVVTDVTDTAFGNFAVYDGTDTLEVDDIMYGPNGLGLGDILEMRGCMFYSYNTRYLLPRKPSDVDWLVASIKDASAASTISIYPNPSNGNFEVEMNDESTREIQIISLLGEVVYQDKISSGLNPFYLNLPAGIYQMVINNCSTSNAYRISVVK